jgi:predicted amidohydrolase YtcJ
MQKWFSIWSFSLFLLELVISMGCVTPLRAPLLFFNGKITTLDPKNPEVSAIATNHGRIIATGSDEEIQNQFPNFTQIDLQKKRIIPGFVESHAHFLGIGYSKINLNLGSTKSETEIIQKVSAQSKLLPQGEWIKGRGWDQNDWPLQNFPTHHALSREVEHHPVILTRIDGHAIWCNQKAMNIAKIYSQKSDPIGGKIERDESGNPTGIFIDKAIDLILRHIPKASLEQDMHAAQIAAQEALQLGITSLHDAGSGQQAIQVVKTLRQKKLSMPRLYIMLNGDDKNLLSAYYKKGPQIDDHLSIRSVKFYADGALGSRGAALLEPYSDDSANQGLLLLTKEQLSQAAEQALLHGFQVATHAIGDKANRLVLDAYQEILQKIKPNTNPRLRIEHAQIVHTSDVNRFQKLEVIASIQPSHCTSDMPWVTARLGETRSQNEAYVWRTFLNNHVLLAAGSDAPIESLNPFYGLYAAVSRKKNKDMSQSGFHEEQALTLTEALAAFTIGGAYAEFQEHQKGHLTPGALADFIVLSDDIFAIEPRKILSIKTEMTVLDGEIVYKKPPD